MLVKDINRAISKQYYLEEKIRIGLDGIQTEKANR